MHDERTVAGRSYAEAVRWWASPSAAHAEQATYQIRSCGPAEAHTATPLTYDSSAAGWAGRHCSIVPCRQQAPATAYAALASHNLCRQRPQQRLASVWQVQRVSGKQPGNNHCELHNLSLSAIHQLAESVASSCSLQAGSTAGGRQQQCQAEPNSINAAARPPWPGMQWVRKLGSSARHGRAEARQGQETSMPGGPLQRLTAAHLMHSCPYRQ
jgi:hypothetical protein